MKNKITFLIVVLSIFFGLLLYININRKSKEEKKAQLEKVEQRRGFVKDSLRQVNEKSETLKRIEKESAEKQRLIELKKIASAKIIDGYTNKSNTKFDVAILIVDNDEHILNDLSSNIAGLYRNQGYSVSSSLFTMSFIKSKYFSQLQNSGTEVIDILNLNKHTDYIVIGTINYSFRKGTLVEGTTICTANIRANIVSVIDKSIKKSISFSVNGNGVTKLQSQEEAKYILIDKYNKEYSSI